MRIRSRDGHLPFLYNEVEEDAVGRLAHVFSAAARHALKPVSRVIEYVSLLDIPCASIIRGGVSRLSFQRRISFSQVLDPEVLSFTLPRMVVSGYSANESWLLAPWPRLRRTQAVLFPSLISRCFGHGCKQPRRCSDRPSRSYERLPFQCTTIFCSYLCSIVYPLLF